jgi:hypothetical protein
MKLELTDEDVMLIISALDEHDRDASGQRWRPDCVALADKVRTQMLLSKSWHRGVIK